MGETMTLRFSHVKLTKNPPENKSLDKILTELEQCNLIKKLLLGYLHHIRDKRNEAVHPDRRFDQEESE